MRTFLAAAVLLAGMGSAHAIVPCDQSSANGSWSAHVDSFVKCMGPITNGSVSLLCSDAYGNQGTLKGLLMIKIGCRITGELALVYADGTTYILPFTQVVMSPNREVIAGSMVNLEWEPPATTFHAIRR